MARAAATKEVSKKVAKKTTEKAAVQRALKRPPTAPAKRAAPNTARSVRGAPGERDAHDAHDARGARGARKNSADLLNEVSQLLYAQAEALDGKQWQAFIDLFADDGVYWAPTDPQHTHWDGMPSIFTEDRDLMTVRMKRLVHPNAWSQQAEWGTSHVVGNVAIERVDANGDVQVRSRFHMMELRRDDVRHFAGVYRHQLARTNRGLRIRLQRVDLVNAQAPYEYVLQAWV
jgi:benzoate/toluate 1,2-dioxygenase subunit beta